MKKIILFSFITVFIISCDKNPENIESELVGKWILKEVLQDPGDGSGVYRPATSNKIIEFYASGVITSNCINFAMQSLRLHGVCLSDSIIDGTYHVECPFRQIIVLTIKYFFETTNGFS